MMNYLNFSGGVLVGFLLMIAIAFIHEGGAQRACEDLISGKCELRWVKQEAAKNA